MRTRSPLSLARPTSALALAAVLTLSACSGGDDEGTGEPTPEREEWPQSLSEACPEVATELASVIGDTSGVPDYAALADALQGYVDNSDAATAEAVRPLADASRERADAFDALTDDQRIALGFAADPDEDVTEGEVPDGQETSSAVPDGEEVEAFNRSEVHFYEALDEGLVPACSDAGASIEADVLS